MDREKRNGVSEEERIKQRNLNWPKRRRIIGRVLFVVLSILAILIVAFAVWAYIGVYKYIRCNSLGWRFVIRSRTFCNHVLVISPFAACCISLTQLGLSRASFIVFLDC